MKKVLLTLLVGLFFAVGSAQAHCGKCGVGDAPKGDKECMMQDKMDRMTKELNLSDEQQAKVQSIMNEKMEKKQQLMEEHHKAMDALHADFQAKLKGVFSEEQMANWEKMKEEKGDMEGHCPMCKKGKKCDMCKMKKGKGNEEMKGKCPMCEKAGKGKMCPMCKMHKKAMKENHDHEGMTEEVGAGNP